MTNKDKHIPQGYKSSPLGIIPEDWEVKRLGELGEVLMCKRIMKYQTDSCGDIPFFKIGTFGGKPDAYIPKEVFDEYKTKYSYPKIGDVLISAAGTIGRSVIFDGTPSYYQDSNIVWIDNDNKQVLNKYLYYYYSTINWITDTGTVPRLYNGALKAIQIPTPPIEQQTRIVSILELWDAAIAKQTALIEQLTLRKRGLMQQLLTGKKRLKGFEGEWMEVRLGDVASINRGGSPRPIEDYITKCEGYNWIKIGDVGQDAKYITSTEEKIIKEGLSKTRFVKSGDFILSNSMSFGRPYILKIDGCIHDGWLVIQEYDQTFNIDFLYYILGYDTTLAQYKSMAAGSGVLNLNKEIVKEVQLRIPSIEEQIAIASILVNADKEIEIQKQKLSSLQSQKRGLMQQLLTGKKQIK